MENQFTRTEMLIGEQALKTLAQKRVAVFGLGGVGSYVVEALARVGIGSLDLIDNDDINITNINRQIIALHSTIGKSKVDVMKERILDINPGINVKKYKMFFSPESSKEFDFSQYVTGSAAAQAKRADKKMPSREGRHAVSRRTDYFNASNTFAVMSVMAPRPETARYCGAAASPDSASSR